jgi:hypothetical protein
MLSITERYGSLYKAWALIESQGFAIEDVFIVATGGGYYSSVLAVLKEIESLRPEKALILVAPGGYDASTTITFPDLTTGSGLDTQVTIQGCGKTVSSIQADWDLSALYGATSPISEPRSQRLAGLVFKDIELWNCRVYGTLTQIAGMVVFDNCMLTKSTAQGVIDLDGAANNYFVILLNTEVLNYGGGTCCVFDNGVDYYISNSILQANNAAGYGIYMTTPSGTSRIVRNTTIQVTSATTGKAIDSSAAISVVTAGNVYAGAAALIGVNVTETIGSVALNTTINANILMA